MRMHVRAHVCVCVRVYGHAAASLKVKKIPGFSFFLLAFSFISCYQGLWLRVKQAHVHHSDTHAQMCTPLNTLKHN